MTSISARPDTVSKFAMLNNQCTKTHIKCVNRLVTDDIIEVNVQFQ